MLSVSIIRKRLAKQLVVKPINKVCNSCKEDKPLDDFYVVTKREKEIVYHICKSCCSTQKKRMQQYYRDWELKKKYGISIEEYQEQCALRKNICDICRTHTKTMHVDHSHKSGRVRGYLCGSCNRGIGLLKDDPKILIAGANYLEKHDNSFLPS